VGSTGVLWTFALHRFKSSAAPGCRPSRARPSRARLPGSPPSASASSCGVVPARGPAWCASPCTPPAHDCTRLHAAPARRSLVLSLPEPA